jgi:hypothetical protein
MRGMLTIIGSGAVSLSGMSATAPAASPEPIDSAALLGDIRRWAAELGFARIGVANIDLAQDEARFLDWLRAGFAGEMHT